jgi:multisubunit Na+/H+ antiporter MnhF subunit
MTESLHPAASHDLPSFITAPGETDVLMVVMSLILLLATLMFGVLFFRLHTLPERIAHKSHKLQFEIVAVLGLLALFTHVHLFWVAGLLLALIDFPDFGGWLGRIARSVEKIAGIRPAEAAEVPHETIAGIARRDGTAEMPPEATVGDRGADGATAAEGAGKRKEPIHA